MLRVFNERDNRMKEVLLYEADDGTVFSTAEEAQKRDRRVEKETEERTVDRANQLTSDLRYEFADGVHTRSICPCGKRRARGRKCFICLIKEFVDESN